MSQPWENPEYAAQRRRQRMRILVPLLLAALAGSFFLLLRRNAPDASAVTVAKTATRPRQQPPRTRLTSIPASVPRNQVSRPLADIFAKDPRAVALPDAGSAASGPEEPPAAEGASFDDFAARKALALSLYRQNELESALEQAQAALALKADEELLELLAKLKKEIRVQRNYDNARTANFIVLFDGYEHEEMKYAVLDILKDAYGEIGKELNHFPSKPISVILYTAKDFSDVTRAPMWSGGLFDQLDGKIRVPVQGAVGNEAALRRVLYHEFTHALLYSLAPACPLWLNEGLAQLLSGEKGVSVAQLIPLGLLEKGFPSEARLAYAAYMESLQAVQDLVDEYGMARLRRLLAGLGPGGDMEMAFNAAYGQPFSRWARQWRPVTRGE
jgi:hypothetical protein